MKEDFLKKAICIAEGNIEKGGGPFGALIVRDGKIIAEEANRVTSMNDPTAHAEILAIRSAAMTLGTWDLTGCELYTSCEPCPMCLGAVYWAHISKVYFAASRHDAMEAGFDDEEMYTEYNKDPSERKIYMESRLKEKGKGVFRKWLEKEDRREY
ncbi:MAG: nucleoside deaminase [Bacteroidales bacterium]|nr:nucleoside deaminase [Bacteroidales bacterium]